MSKLALDSSLVFLIVALYLALSTQIGEFIEVR